MLLIQFSLVFEQIGQSAQRAQLTDDIDVVLGVASVEELENVRWSFEIVQISDLVLRDGDVLKLVVLRFRDNFDCYLLPFIKKQVLVF